MNIEIKDFFLTYYNKEKHQIRGTLRIYVKELKLIILGVNVFCKRELSLSPHYPENFKIERIEPSDEFSVWERQKELIKRTVCKGASDDEFLLFLHVAKKTGLDPLLRQIYSVPRGNQRTIQTSIDGLRLIACRTGEYMPGKESTFSYDSNGGLLSATAYVKKSDKNGNWHEISHTILYEEFASPTNFWKKMPHQMLSKCAEAACLRKAFPDCQKIYLEEEPNIDFEEKKEEFDQEAKQDSSEIKNCPNPTYCI